jgi:drug/metabolite transporter (DMT)-like permease
MNMEKLYRDKSSSHAWICGFLGVVGFSLTLPMTRLAIAVFDPVLVGLGRALIAAALGLILLISTRQKIPPAHLWWRFLIVGGGVVIGFPLLSSLAMRHVPAAHGAVFTGLIPLITALVARLRGDGRPSAEYWFFSIAGFLMILAFAINSGAGTLQFADLALFAAVVAAGIGYAEGALLARIFGSWQVICWALLLSAPLVLAVLACRSIVMPVHAFDSGSLAAWFGFLYISVISMFAAFMLWYRGLALGGIAQVGQLQLLQPFMTIFASIFWFGEQMHMDILFFASGVAVLILMSRYSAARCPSDKIVLMR